MTAWQLVSGTFITLAAILAVQWPSQGAVQELTSTVEVLIPEFKTDGEAYLCTRVPLPDSPQRLIGVQPLSKQEVVHHMLLYGCASSGSSEPVWECVGHGICGEAGQQVLYGWGKDAPAMTLPPGVGFHVGQGSSVHSLVLQVHFLAGRPAADESGVRLSLTSDHMPFSAGMLMYASSFSIPPGRSSTLVPNGCCLRGFEPAHGFAFRVHTHALGRSVWLDRLEGSGTETRLVEYSPQLPQGFTPVGNITFWPGEKLQATCDFDSRSAAHVVRAGATHHDEMCNLYFMMWTELPIFLTCFNHHPSVERHGAGGIPAKADLVPESDSHWRPPPSLQQGAAAASPVALGQVTGVAKGHNGSVWVLHRGDRIWDASSFEGGGGERTAHTEAIDADTVLQLDQDTGEVLSSWGKGQLLMPHMVTVDRQGAVWVADVALQQVLKFTPDGQPLLQLGRRLEPGHDAEHLCKPTHVALANNGTIYVSDGYCNARVMEYEPDGTWRGAFDLPAAKGEQIPHSLAIDECQGELYVAARETGLVHAFDLASRRHKGTWDVRKHGQVYAIATGPYGVLMALCWDRGAHGSPSSLVLLGAEPGQPPGGLWRLEGVQAPHDLALVAAPVRLAGQERPVAVIVGESRPSGSRLLKFLLLPAGSALPSTEDDAAMVYPSASRSWQHILGILMPDAASHLEPSTQHAAHHHHTHQQHARRKRRLQQADRAKMKFHLPGGWQDGLFAWLLYGSGGSSLLDLKEREETSGLGYSATDAILLSVPLLVLAVLLAVLLWRLAAPASGERELEEHW